MQRPDSLVYTAWSLLHWWCEVATTLSRGTTTVKTSLRSLHRRFWIPECHSVQQTKMTLLSEWPLQQCSGLPKETVWLTSLSLRWGCCSYLSSYWDLFSSLYRRFAMVCEFMADSLESMYWFGLVCSCVLHPFWKSGGGLHLGSQNHHSLLKFVPLTVLKVQFSKILKYVLNLKYMRKYHWLQWDFSRCLSGWLNQSLNQ